VNERPQHEVVLTRPFYLGRFELTNAEMRRFVAHDSGQFPRDERLTLDGDRQPAVAVSWEEAMGFAAYFGLRLPTEAEWEYAARAGVTTRYPWGNDIRKGARMGNVFNESMKIRLPEMDWPAFPWDDGFVATAPVGSFPPNEWGFHDMFGNVWEWVADSFDDGLYARLPPRVTDPLHDSGGRRTLRGGGFGNAPRGSGIPYRYGMPPHSRHFGNGFRVARWP
jgi:formylglycine-generating enzyme required for sulfatase activity